jgi:hypothetical protein
LIRNEKPIVLFERHCHATEKSEAIACARSSRSSWLTRWWTRKRIIGKKWRAEEEERHKGSLTQKKARVTRLGEFSPTGRLFSMGSFFENYKSSPNLGATFSTEKVEHYFFKKWVGQHFG